MDIVSQWIQGLLTFVLICFHMAMKYIGLILGLWVVLVMALGFLRRKKAECIGVAWAGKVLVSVLLLPVIGVAVWYLPLHLTWTDREEIESSEAGTVLSIKTKPDFPLSEPLDPRTDVLLTLYRRSDDVVVAEHRITVAEDSDVDRAHVKWVHADHVLVDFGRDVVVTLESTPNTSDERD